MKGDAFPRKIHSHYGHWRAPGAHLRGYLRFFVVADPGLQSGYEIMGYGAGKVDDVAAQANQARPVGRALQGSAKRKAV
jgi:hypothetical protein